MGDGLTPLPGSGGPCKMQPRRGSRAVARCGLRLRDRSFLSLFFFLEGWGHGGSDEYLVNNVIRSVKKGFPTVDELGKACL